MSIDTSTTAGKIAVMQAFEDGKSIEGGSNRGGWLHINGGTPSWNWSNTIYRIKPQTVEEAARDQMKNNTWSQATMDESFIEGAEFGANWQKEQDND